MRRNCEYVEELARTWIEHFETESEHVWCAARFFWTIEQGDMVEMQVYDQGLENNLTVAYAEEE